MLPDRVPAKLRFAPADDALEFIEKRRAIPCKEDRQGIEQALRSIADTGVTMLHI